MANRNRNWKNKNKESESKNNKPGNSKRYHRKDESPDTMLDAKGRDNDPNWYFTDAAMAEQVSQLAFQNLAGYPVNFSGKDFDVPNLVRMFYNPCPGVIKSEDYGTPVLNKTSGINLAGFKLFSKLSAYTGRTATYGPQDISMMILAFGEVISVMEWMRRVFGLANASSMRNRSYPREVLSWGCLTDEDDFFKNFSNYRTRFNGLITMVNQLPIPKGITYFDKCAALYEKVYLDSPSSMGQTLITCPFSTWTLDEVSDPNGSRLATTRWMCEASLDHPTTNPTVRKFSEYLDTADAMIGALLNSSSLQVVYTDLLNLSVKVGQDFWKLDYLLDGYLVLPEYNANMLLQMHNATIAGVPFEPADLATPEHVTAYNDVVSNPSVNSVFYNPGFIALFNNPGGSPRTGKSVLIDMLTDNPNVVDRVECTRYTSISGTKYYVGASGQNDHLCDATLPDHYCVMVSFLNQDPTRALANYLGATLVSTTQFNFYVSYIGTIDWAPRIWEVDGNNALTGNYLGDLNFYTVVDDQYLRKLHQFMTLGLFDLRRKSNGIK